MIATAARSWINIASTMADLSATGVGFAITEAPMTAEQRRLSRKRHGSTERSHGRLAKAEQ
jgi:hypothetical protein